MATDKNGNYIDLNTSTAIIKKAIRKLSKEYGIKPLSVRRDWGAAGGWVNISGSNKFGQLTKQEEQVLMDFGLVYPHGGIKNTISPDEHDSIYYRALEILGSDAPAGAKEIKLEDNPRAWRVLDDIAHCKDTLYHLRHDVSNWCTENPESSNDKAVRNILFNLDSALSALESDKYFNYLMELD